jgi:hypothetical protein
MHRTAKRVLNLLLMLGIDPGKAFRSLRALPTFLGDFLEFRRQRPKMSDQFPFGKLYPCLEDRFAQSGHAAGHYFHQDLLVARRINANNPKTHVDVGSRIDGFVAHVASFREIEVFDIRPLEHEIPNMRFVRADLMAPIVPSLVDYCDSISCLHALEHFGLGRYGDSLNYDGHVVGLKNLTAILQKGGKLYLSVPIGPQRIEFNAHRVFSLRYLRDCFEGRFRLERFSYVDDKGDLHENVPTESDGAVDDYGCMFGCGILELTKL